MLSFSSIHTQEMVKDESKDTLECINNSM